MSHQAWHCFTDTLFSLARRICEIDENENVKEKCFKELKKTLLVQTYPRPLMEASILKAKEITVKVLKQPKTTKNEENLPFTTTYNPYSFPKIKQTISSILKQCSAFFRRRNLLTL